MEACSSINTLNLDTIMPGPEDYAIESLATSLLGGTAEATTETFYTGKHIGYEYYSTRPTPRREYNFNCHKVNMASHSKRKENTLQAVHETPSIRSCCVLDITFPVNFESLDL